MSWPTVIWSMAAAACLTMALPHLLVGITQHGRRVHLLFVLAALAVAGMAAAELAVMRAVTIQESGRAVQIAQVPTFIVVVAIVGFVQLYFGTGRLWLGLLACGLRAVCLVVNFADPPNMNFAEITALRTYRFLGEMVTMPVGPRNPWILLAYASSLLVLAFVIDASLKLWRQGTREHRRRAVVVGGSIVVFVILAQGLAVLINAGAINLPYSVSIPFVAIVAAMGFELSYDVVSAAQLSRALRSSEERMSLAAESARLTMWEWDITPDEVWMTQEGRALLGFAPDARIRFASLVERVHPEDREARETVIRGAVEAGGSYEMEYRLLMPDGSVRWIAARGRCAAGDDRNCRRLLGASMDITERKQADAETRQLRDELAHVTRVATLSELSGSLAHELNQPLGIILSNAQAAQRLLAQDPPDIAEVRDVLTDIVAEDRRAGEVIQRLRALLKRGETTLLPLLLDEVVAEVLHLTNADLIGRGVSVVRELTGELPRVQGDRIQLQQVVLNLILNGADAMSENAAGARRLHVGVARNDGVVRLSVRDEGCGLPADAEKIFEAFYTTKAHGLGMGLAICRSIVAAHEGRLWAERHPQCGSVFHLELPALPGNGA